MANEVFNRAYLESIPFSELLKIADSLGIDVPENLNRNFLIGEMLDSSEENKKVSTEFDIDISEKELLAETEELSMRSCNSTEVQIVLRNPAWAYVYWNISDSDRTSLEKAFVSQMMIRVSSFSEKEQIKPDEYCDFNISKEDSGQYVLLPAGKKFFRVDLLFNLDGIIDILSSSVTFEMPKGSPLLSDIRPGRENDFSPIMALSGIKELLMEHYKNHRESFS